MTPNEWAGMAVAVTTLVGAVAVGVRHLVKHYLYELRPNGGSSVKDKINSLEEKVELLTDLVKELIKR
jgi:hypothetical protein